ncbi:lipoate--protein ligase family protein [Paludisphaera rhizosphaerae]|uniref:lipoate--protein ligase family protein n=1 Tax=Paludisphaera rhizosphaerae TaxID=2711216 RepID=UPI001F0FA2C2|nr:lipoate--protein ligase family protein [Paludisphaera rhizosphaerae]
MAPDASLLTLPTVHENLAFDEAMLVDADENDRGPLLRFWEQTDYAVVLGSSRRLHKEVDVDACREDGVTIARRTSGGGTVVIGPGALNVTVVLPMDYAPEMVTVDGTQTYILGRIAEAIRARGPAVEVKGSGDLTIAGRKFSGSAQRRLRRRALVHATILHEFSISRISRYLRIPERQPGYRESRTHEDFLMNVPLGRRILIESIRSAWPHPALLTTASDVPQVLLETLCVGKFSDRSWIERL